MGQKRTMRKLPETLFAPEIWRKQNMTLNCANVATVATFVFFFIDPLCDAKIVQQWKLGVMPYFPDLTDDPVAKNGKSVKSV